MHNEFESKAIIEKHVKEMVADLTVQDDHGLGWVGDNIENHLTGLIFHALALSKDAQDYIEKNDVSLSS